MLLICLALSIWLLLGAERIIRKQEPNLKWEVFKHCGWFAVVPIFLCMFSQVLIAQALTMMLLVALWHRAGWTPDRYLRVSLAATVVIYGIMLVHTFIDMSVLRARYPYESMAHVAGADHVELGPAASPWWDSVEEKLTERAREEWRQHDLKRLHESALEFFATRPGFGVGRMPDFEKWELPDDGAVPQPGPPGYLPPDALDRAMVTPGDGWWLHANHVLEFADPKRFGYFKDRRHVAGFAPHGLRSQPETRVQHIDLIGLVQHDRPVAYVSENLPRMEELKHAPTRPLDDFETAGLRALRQGEDLFTRTRGDTIRMLGAIRAAQPCTRCHEGKRGGLLGAFSYTLKP